MDPTGDVPVATYFADDPNLLREFAVDYELLTKVDQALQVKNGACFMCFCCGCCLPFLPCQLSNTRDLNRAQHVAISRDGIRYSVDKHPSGCRSNCQEVGKVTRTVPFDKESDNG